MGAHTVVLMQVVFMLAGLVHTSVVLRIPPLPPIQLVIANKMKFHVLVHVCSIFKALNETSMVFAHIDPFICEGIHVHECCNQYVVPPNM